MIQVRRHCAVPALSHDTEKEGSLSCGCDFTDSLTPWKSNFYQNGQDHCLSPQIPSWVAQCLSLPCSGISLCAAVQTKFFLCSSSCHCQINPSATTTRVVVQLEAREAVWMVLPFLDDAGWDQVKQIMKTCPKILPSTKHSWTVRTGLENSSRLSPQPRTFCLCLNLFESWLSSTLYTVHLIYSEDN